MAINLSGAYEKGTYKRIVLLNAVTATTNSAAALIQGAKRVTLQFTRANHSSGSSAFKVQVSYDGTNWVDYNMLIDNVTNTNAQTKTRILTKTLSSDTVAICAMDLENFGAQLMRVVVTETTDGTHSAEAFVEF